MPASLHNKQHCVCSENTLLPSARQYRAAWRQRFNPILTPSHYLVPSPPHARHFSIDPIPIPSRLICPVPVPSLSLPSHPHPIPILKFSHNLSMVCLLSYSNISRIAKNNQLTARVKVHTTNYTVFQKKFTLFVFTITKSDVDQF